MYKFKTNKESCIKCLNLRYKNKKFTNFRSFYEFCQNSKFKQLSKNIVTTDYRFLIFSISIINSW